MDQLKNTATYDTDSIDEILANVKVTTENIRQLTESLKSNPAILIRGNNVAKGS